MTENTFTLTIEKLAGLGDGLAMHEGKRIFTPLTLTGDVVRARIKRSTKDADYAELVEVMTPGPERVKPACRHFSECGGCTLQHLSAAAYGDFKWQMARAAVRKAGFDPELVAPLLRIPVNARRRVELGVQERRFGYFALGSHRRVDIEECRILEPQLEALLLRLKPELLRLEGLDTLSLNKVDEGYDLLLSGDERSSAWRLVNDKAIRRISVRQGGQVRTVFQSGPVTVTLGDIKVEVPPSAFLQASAEAQAVMTHGILASLGRARRVIDLFSGIGTYSFPLAAQGCEVTAVEGEASMVGAVQVAARKYGLETQVKAMQRDLFRNPLPLPELQNYDAVIINPPYAGAKEQSEILAAAKVKKLVMISCNPATFARDVRAFKEGGARLLKVVPIDQFTYSSHLEILAEFSN